MVNDDSKPVVMEQNETVKNHILRIEAKQLLAGIVDKLKAGFWGVLEYNYNNALTSNGYQTYQLTLAIGESSTTVGQYDYRENVIGALSDFDELLDATTAVIDRLTSQLDCEVGNPQNSYTTALYMITTGHLKQTVSLSFHHRGQLPERTVPVPPIEVPVNPASDSLETKDPEPEVEDVVDQTEEKSTESLPSIVDTLSEMGIKGKRVYINSFGMLGNIHKDLERVFRLAGADVAWDDQFDFGVEKKPVDYFITAKENYSPLYGFINIRRYGNKHTQTLLSSLQGGVMTLEALTAKQVAELSKKYVVDNSEFKGKRVLISKEFETSRMAPINYKVSDIAEVIEYLGGEAVFETDDMDVKSIDMTFTYYVSTSTVSQLNPRLKGLKNISVTTFTRRVRLGFHHNFDDFRCYSRDYKDVMTDDS